MSKNSNLRPIENFKFLELFDLHQRYFSKIFYKKTFKIKKISTLLDRFLISVLKKAIKFSNMANRYKITFYDLVNSINQINLFFFNIGASNYYRDLPKNNKFLVNDPLKISLSNEIFKEEGSVYQFATIFQSWNKNTSSETIKTQKYFDNYSFRKQLNAIPLNELIFLCHFFKTIFNKETEKQKIYLKVISSSKIFKNIFCYFFFWAVYSIFKNEDRKQIIFGTKIIYALSLNNNFLVLPLHKKINSVLVEVILRNTLKIKKKNEQILFNLLETAITLEEQFLKTSIFNYSQLNFFFLKKLFRCIEISPEISNSITVFCSLDRFKFTSELYITPFLKNSGKKEIQPKRQT